MRQSLRTVKASPRGGSAKDRGPKEVIARKARERDKGGGARLCPALPCPALLSSALQLLRAKQGSCADEGAWTMGDGDDGAEGEEQSSRASDCRGAAACMPARLPAGSGDPKSRVWIVAVLVGQKF